jgi:hypothetical protein
MESSSLPSPARAASSQEPAAIRGSAPAKWLGTGLVLAALCACRSTAPYTLPAAAINTAIAAGASAYQRSKGGCYSACTNGTVCNTRTGYCVPASEQDVCVEDGAGGMRCAPMGVIGESRPEARIPGGATIGVSPVTGTVPPPPAEASPKPP